MATPTSKPPSSAATSLSTTDARSLLAADMPTAMLCSSLEPTPGGPCDTPRKDPPLTITSTSTKLAASDASATDAPTATRGYESTTLRTSPGSSSSSTRLPFAPTLEPFRTVCASRSMSALALPLRTSTLCTLSMLVDAFPLAAAPAVDDEFQRTHSSPWGPSMPIMHRRSSSPCPPMAAWTTSRSARPPRASDSSSDPLTGRRSEPSEMVSRWSSVTSECAPIASVELTARREAGRCTLSGRRSGAMSAENRSSAWPAAVTIASRRSASSRVDPPLRAASRLLLSMRTLNFSVVLLRPAKPTLMSNISVSPSSSARSSLQTTDAPSCAVAEAAACNTSAGPMPTTPNPAVSACAVAKHRPSRGSAVHAEMTRLGKESCMESRPRGSSAPIGMRHSPTACDPARMCFRLRSTSASTCTVVTLMLSSEGPSSASLSASVGGKIISLTVIAKPPVSAVTRKCVAALVFAVMRLKAFVTSTAASARCVMLTVSTTEPGAAITCKCICTCIYAHVYVSTIQARAAVTCTPDCCTPSSAA